MKKYYKLLQACEEFYKIAGLVACPRQSSVRISNWIINQYEQWSKNSNKTSHFLKC